MCDSILQWAIGLQEGTEILGHDERNLQHLNHLRQIHGMQGQLDCFQILQTPTVKGQKIGYFIKAVLVEDLIPLGCVVNLPQAGS